MRRITKITAVLILASTAVHAQTDTTTAFAGDSILNGQIAPTFTTSLDALEGESEAQDVSGLLQSSKDVFTS